MKIALCMSGQARGVVNGWPSICGNLMNPNAPEVFVHVWGAESDEQVKAIRALYNPVSMVVEPPRLFSNSRLDIDRQRARYPHGSSRDDFVDRSYSMWYSIQQANLVKEKYRLEHDIHYDYVIRARFDLSFSRPIECVGYDNSVIHLTDKCIPEMIDDRFAFGPTRLINIYSSGFAFYDQINALRSAKDGIFCAEIILYEMLRTFGVEYRFIPSLQILRVPLE
jgi:hypothetical protein